MKAPHTPMAYETPLDKDILEAYFHKHPKYNRSEIRRIKRSLRKLTAA